MPPWLCSFPLQLHNLQQTGGIAEWWNGICQHSFNTHFTHFSLAPTN